MIKLIICTDNAYAIGKDKQLLFHCKEDLKYFKDQTSGCTVVMGNNTYKSLPFKGGLPNRNNIVLTSKKQPAYIGLRHESGVRKVGDIDILIDELLDYQEDAFIIGGAKVYEEFKDIVEEVHWTKVDKTFEYADTFFDMSWVRNALRWEKVSIKELTEDVRVNVYKKIC